MIKTDLGYKELPEFPKYWDRQAWANSVDTNGVYTVYPHSFDSF